MKKTAFSERLKTTKCMEISNYGKTLQLVLVPVYNEKNEYLGRMTQWIDRTAEVVAEQEVARLVSEAVAGNLSQRVEVNKLPGGLYL